MKRNELYDGFLIFWSIMGSTLGLKQKEKYNQKDKLFIKLKNYKNIMKKVKDLYPQIFDYKYFEVR